MPNMLRFAPTIGKRSDFLPKMSGILDTRIPTFCKSQSATLGDTSWARLTIELIRCLRIRGRTPHIPILEI